VAVVPTAKLPFGLVKVIVVIAEVLIQEAAVLTAEPEPLKSEFSVVRQVLY
jgi:hypothetical protein